MVFQKLLFLCSTMPIVCEPWRNYLENLTTHDKFINKQVRLFIHQTMCWEEKINSTSQQGCEMAVK